MAKPEPHAPDERTVPDRNQGGVGAKDGLDALERDRPGALGDLGLATVLDELGAGFPGVGEGRFLGGVEVLPDEADLGAEVSHGADLVGIRVQGRENRERNSRPPGRPGEALAEVSRRPGDPSRSPGREAAEPRDGPPDPAGRRTSRRPGP